MAEVSFQSKMAPAMPFERATDPQATPDERTFATFMHLTVLLCHFAPVIGPLIMWQIKKDQSPYLDDHGREAVNFQISLVVYAIAFAIVGAITCGVGFLLYLPLYALALVGMILAAVAANRGQFYRYPACLRFIK